MNWSDQVFRYCERGSDPAFWAEPFNAIGNFAFIIVAILAAVRAQRRPVHSDDAALVWVLIALSVAVGIGSFAFHTTATRLGVLADVIPIGLFMLAYLTFALRRFAGWTLLQTAFGTAGFILVLAVASSVPACRPAGAGLDALIALPSWCLNGSVSYLPALGALLAVAGLARSRNAAAARALFAASGVFAVALALRSLDLVACPILVIGGVKLGTHGLWHVTNALVLQILLTAAIVPASRR